MEATAKIIEGEYKATKIRRLSLNVVRKPFEYHSKSIEVAANFSKIREYQWASL